MTLLVLRRACLWGRLQEGWAALGDHSMPCYNSMCENTLTNLHAFLPLLHNLHCLPSARQKREGGLSPPPAPYSQEPDKRQSLPPTSSGELDMRHSLNPATSGTRGGTEPSRGFGHVCFGLEHFGCTRNPVGTTCQHLQFTGSRSRVRFFVKSARGMWSVCDRLCISLCCPTCRTCPGAYAVSAKLIYMCGVRNHWSPSEREGKTSSRRASGWAASHFSPGSARIVQLSVVQSSLRVRTRFGALESARASERVWGTVCTPEM